MSDDAHFRLRIPRELKAWVDARALQNNRSINAEIVWLLQQEKGNEERQVEKRAAIKSQGKHAALKSLESDVLRLQNEVDRLSKKWGIDL